jgi:hypothetical protein
MMVKIGLTFSARVLIEGHDQQGEARRSHSACQRGCSARTSRRPFRSESGTRVWKQSWGTVTISAVGMVGKGAGWGIPPSFPSIC